MKKIFISYSTQDIERVREICNILKQHSIPFWIAERDLPLGEDFAEKIVEVIQSCSCVLLLVSKHSQASPYIKNELTQAKKLNKKVIAVKLEDVEFQGTHSFYLSSENWTTAFHGKEEELERVIAEIKKLIIQEHENEDCINPQKEEKQNHDTTDSDESLLPVNNQRKSETEPKCPICKSHRISINDSMEILRLFTIGTRKIADTSSKIIAMFLFVLIVIFFLQKIHTIREPILQMIAVIPYLGDYICNRESIDDGLIKVLGFNVLLMLPCELLAYLVNKIRAKKHRKIAEKGFYTVECRCEDCDNIFSIEYSADNWRVRSTQEKSNKEKTKIAWAALCFIIGCVLLLYIAISLLEGLFVILIALLLEFFVLSLSIFILTISLAFIILWRKYGDIKQAAREMKNNLQEYFKVIFSELKQK